MAYEINSATELLKSNTYPGRGIITGMSPDGRKLVLAYFIMGRSANSRNRVFREEGNAVTIYPADPSKVEDPSLIIYSPVRVLENSVIVTNGDQTDTIYDFMKEGKSFEEALETREFEPDSPNWTPRISGVLNLQEKSYRLSILKSEDPDGTACARFTYSYKAEAGLGHFIHTYQHDGNPIPTFEGEPVRVSIPDTADHFAKELWDCLNADNKISLYVRYTDISTGEYAPILINKYNS